MPSSIVLSRKKGERVSLALLPSTHRDGAAAYSCARRRVLHAAAAAAARAQRGGGGGGGAEEEEQEQVEEEETVVHSRLRGCDEELRRLRGGCSGRGLARAVRSYTTEFRYNALTVVRSAM